MGVSVRGERSLVGDIDIFCQPLRRNVYKVTAASNYSCGGTMTLPFCRLLPGSVFFEGNGHDPRFIDTVAEETRFP